MANMQSTARPHSPSGRQVRDRYTHLDWFKATIEPLLRAAREDSTGAKWGLLGAPQFRGQRAFCGFNRQYGKSEDDWYGALAAYGLLPNEVQKIRRAAVKAGIVLAGERKRKFSRAELATWFDSKVAPIIKDCREANNDVGWAKLALARFYSCPEFTSFCRLYGKSANDWYGALTARGLSPDEIHRLKYCARKAGGRSIAATSSKKSAVRLRSLENRINKLLIEARLSDDDSDWAKLGYTANRQQPGCTYFCRLHGQKPDDWYRALEQRFQLKVEEIKRIRHGAMAQWRRHSLHKANKYRALVVGARRYLTEVTVCPDFLKIGIQGDLTTQAEDGRPAIVVVDRIRDTTAFREHSLYRLALGRVIGSADWSSVTALYEAAYPHLPSTLFKRVVARKLVEEGFFDDFRPRCVISAASGGGAFFLGLQESVGARQATYPQVQEIDSTPGISRLSVCPSKVNKSIQCVLPSLKESAGFDLIECGSPRALGHDALCVLLNESARLLRPSGLLCLSVEGAFFSQEMIDALEQLGFKLTEPPNSRLQVANLSKQAAAALQSVRFILAQRTGRQAQPLQPSAICIPFLRRASHDEEVELMRGLLQKTLRASKDQQLLSLSSEYRTLVQALSCQSLIELRGLTAGLLGHFVSKLLPACGLPRFPPLAHRPEQVAALREYCQAIYSAVLLDQQDLVEYLSILKQTDTATLTAADLAEVNERYAQNILLPLLRDWRLCCTRLLGTFAN